MSGDTDLRKSQFRRFFDSVAGDYDSIGPASFAYFGRRLVEEAGVEAGMRVLDVASGRGAVLFPAAERVGPTGSATGIDLSEAMAGAANDDAARRGIAARLRVMDAEQLDFPDAAFDRVLCGFGIMFLPDLDRALGEFRRVLAPDGRVAVSTWQASQVEDLSIVIAELGLGRTAEPAWITDPDELSQLLRRAGFQNTTAKAHSEYFEYSSLEQYWQTAQTTGIRRRLDSLTPNQVGPILSALARRLGTSGPTGEVRVRASALIAVAGR